VWLRRLSGAALPQARIGEGRLECRVMTLPAGYPGDLARSVTLADGTVVRIRPIQPDDASSLQALHSRLSHETAYQRFFAIVRRLPPDWARALANVDYQQRLALVVEADGAGGDLIGVGRYEPTNEQDTVEVAFVVQDSWQNRGLGTILFDAILQAAATRSYRRFRAYVLNDNKRMLDLISRFTRIESRKTEHGVTDLVFTLAPEKVPGAT
jgi:RimJ/RimL family protein N-acetyltransferase